MMSSIPKKQKAVQLIGPDELTLNTDKDVYTPGPFQILCRIEAVGLCFSDFQLLKQLSGHVRKSEVVAGLAPEVLDEIPGYVPGDMPTVPGHEAVVEVCVVGEKVKNARPRERYLVQTD
ncbi:MAG: alcohol dehydrogenase catalytic domain-containing protein, partial [Planctomycetes bacterium]|nr:alcohol dehydrogenase catalytic domain-containing protein [Planctomycetota bacterium]